jgi:hypothetical protein
VLFHSTTITVNYQPVIQCMTIRQSAKIVEILEKEVLRTGDRAKVKFQFMFRPEFLKVGMRLIFREGRCKGIGVISAVSSTDPTKTPSTTSTTTSSSTTKQPHHDDKTPKSTAQGKPTSTPQHTTGKQTGADSKGGKINTNTNTNANANTAGGGGKTTQPSTTQKPSASGAKQPSSPQKNVKK